MFVRCLRRCVNGWGRRCAAGVLPVWQYYVIPAGHRRHAAHRRPHPFTYRRKYYAWGPMCRCGRCINYGHRRKIAKRQTTSTVERPDEQDLFGHVSDITEDPEDTVEPSSEAEDPTTRSNPPVEAVVDFTDTENPSKAPAPDKDDKKEASKAAIKWSPSPLPVNRGNPCVRKRLELVRLPCPIKQYLRARGIKAGEPSTLTLGQPTPGTGTSKEPTTSGIKTLLSKAVEGPSGESTARKELLTYAESWPDRGISFCTEHRGLPSLGLLNYR